MRWLYLTGCLLVLIWTTVTAFGTVRLGHKLLGLVESITPVVWVLLCSVGLRLLLASKLTDPTRGVTQALLVTSALGGTVIAHFIGAFATLGFNYGNDEEQVVRGYLTAFGMSLAVVATPWAILAMIAMSLAILRRTGFASQSRDPSDD
jgi:hypothetical protein